MHTAHLMEAEPSPAQCEEAEEGRVLCRGWGVNSRPGACSWVQVYGDRVAQSGDVAVCLGAVCWVKFGKACYYQNL